MGRTVDRTARHIYDYAWPGSPVDCVTGTVRVPDCWLVGLLWRSAKLESETSGALRPAKGGVVRQVETDYLVVGAGATGMAFVDTLVAESDVDVVMIDRRHRPGGHWLDAYPFVRLHQPSAYYGVNSRVLGNDRVDDSGPNAGYYERATAAEICDYYNRVLEEHLLASGRVRFFAMSEYRGIDGGSHQFVSRLTGAETSVTVRHKLVDATYVESSIPSRHTPVYKIDPGVRVIPPNALVDLDERATGFTVIGAGKTAMDTCNWLLEAGVDPDKIRWIRPRDGWFLNREFMQPLDLVASYMQLQSRWVESAAACDNATDFVRRLEADGMMIRIDPNVEPGVFRGATVSLLELDALRRIKNVVRVGRVRRLGTNHIIFDDSSIVTDARQVYVDCTAEGLRPVSSRSVFETYCITPQYVTIGVAPWSAATIAAVEASGQDETHKNDLCPPVAFTGETSSLLPIARAGIAGLVARTAEPELAAWTERCRLNPARGAAEHLDDPKVQDAFTSLAANIGTAMQNLERVLA